MRARNDGEVRGLREPRAARWWLAGFVVVVATTVAPATAATVNQEMMPGEILGVESLIGAEMTTPADGRLRGYGFAATVTAAGTTEAAEANLATLGPASGQRLVAFSLRFDLVRHELDDAHPVRATLVVDAKRTSLDDGDFVASDERTYVASVPAGAKQVALEMSAAGLAQTFSLTERRRVGDQPTVLYRDPVGPEVETDVNDEATLAATSARGITGAVSITLKGARLSYFSPGEPITTPGSPAQAFLVLEASGEGADEPERGVAFYDFTAVSASGVVAHLPDASVVTARHAGPEDGLLAGWYYFVVPADIAGARVSIEPGTVEGVQAIGGVYETRIEVEGKAEFDIAFAPPGAAHAPSAPTTTTAEVTTTTRPADARRAVPAGEDPANPGSWLLGGLVVAAVATAVVRARRSPQGWPPPVPAPTTAERPEPERLVDVVATPVSLHGPGAEAAARAAVVEVLARGGDAGRVVVVAGEPVRNLLPPKLRHPGLRLVGDGDELAADLEALRLGRQRMAMEMNEAEASRDAPSRDPVLVVAPASLATTLHRRLGMGTGASDRHGVAVVCLGTEPGAYPSARVDVDGTVTTGDGERWRRAATMGKGEAAFALAAASPPGPPTPAPGAGPREAVADAASDGGAVAEAPAPAVVSVRVLGPYRIAVGAAEVASGLRAKARELLAYLVVHREGATMEAAMEALWPGTDPDKSQAYFRTILANLRSTLRSAASLDETTAVVERIGARYRLAPGLVEVDLWRFNDALVAGAAGDEGERRQRAAQCYGGDFAVGEDFVWAEPIREQLRRKAIDNLTALAALHRARGDLDEALAAMDRAIDQDPYAEELYEAVMDLQIMLGRRDAAARTLRLLERRLAELDVEPQDRTRRLLYRQGRQ